MKTKINGLGFLPTQEKANMLWGQAAFDMSVEEVVHVAPNALRVVDGGELADGARELLREPAVMILEWHLRCSYYFLQGRLSVVMLTADHLTGCAKVMQVFRGLRVALCEKYGPPIHSEMSSDDAEDAWMCGSVSICVSALAENVPGVDYVNIVLTVPDVQVSGFSQKLADEALYRSEESVAWLTINGPRVLAAAKALENGKSYQEALDAYDELEDLSGGIAWRGIAESSYGRARIYANQGRLADAISEMGMAVAIARRLDDRLARETEAFSLELENRRNSTG